MRRMARSGMIVVLIAVAALAVGCCDKEKKQIAYLNQQMLEMSNSNKDLRGQLVAARTRESDLLSQTESKDLQLTALRAENADLKGKLAGGGTTAPPPGRQTPLYKVTVGSDILFGAGRASLSASGRSRLAAVANEIKSKYDGMAVRVYGYTDSDPIKRTRKLWTDNLDLSANRAMAVTRYLISRGIKAASVETIAMGATHFVASNTTSAGKAKNRRVVILVVR